MSDLRRNFDGTVYLGSDHAGLELKEHVQDMLSARGYKVIDMGPHEYNEDDDFPELITPVAKKVAEDHRARGLIFGKSGQGEAMAANRVKGVRAAVYTGGPDEVIRLAREHNNANVLSLGSEFSSPDEAWRAAHLFLGTPFSGAARHERRIKQLDD